MNSSCLFSVRKLACSSARRANLSGKVALVTASTEGIGFAIAKKLGKDGAKVVICSRKQNKVDNALQELRKEVPEVSGMACHVGKPEDRKSLLEFVSDKHGGLDILVTNAGLNPYYGPTLNTPMEAYDKIFDVNVKSTFQWIKESVPLMENKSNSSVTIVSSIAAYSPINLLGIYSVSKTALVGLTKVLSPELGHKNIRINCIAPGIIKTKFSGALWQDPAMEKKMAKQITLGRFGTPDDCSGFVAFLSSDEASYCTGETYVIAGGMPSRL